MKHFRKIMLLALGFGLILVAFFSMHGRTAKAQSGTGPTNNTQISLYCTEYTYAAVVSQNTCGNWQAMTSAGYYPTFSSIPQGETLIITDVECVTVGAGGEYGVCSLAAATTVPISLPNTNYGPWAEAGTVAGPYGTSVMGLHLTTGVPFTAPYLPSLFSTGSPRSMTMQGYLIATPPAVGG